LKERIRQASEMITEDMLNHGIGLCTNIQNNWKSHSPGKRSLGRPFKHWIET
ncbi:hypothetical protein L9F63_008452, partial [Diploptera punctata]